MVVVWNWMNEKGGSDDYNDDNDEDYDGEDDDDERKRWWWWYGWSVGRVNIIMALLWPHDNR